MKAKHGRKVKISPASCRIYLRKVPRKFHETLLRALFTRESCKIRRNIALDLCTYLFYLGGRFTLTRTSLAVDNKLAVHACIPRNPVIVSHTGLYVRTIVAKARNGDEISVEPEGKRRAGISSAGRPWWERDAQTGERRDENERWSLFNAQVHQGTGNPVYQFAPFLLRVLLTR